MIRLLITHLIISLLFAGTVNAAGIDVGAPSCHTGETQEHKSGHQHDAPFHYDASTPPGSHAERGPGNAVCDCHCPCCDYVAHQLPLPFPWVNLFHIHNRVVQHAGRIAEYQSISISPPTPPPDTW